MRWLPRSLFGQVLLALLLGLLAAQAVGVWLMVDERGRFAGRLLGGYAAQRIAGIVSLLDGADQRERARLVRALSVPPTRVTLDEPWRSERPTDTEEARRFAGHLERELARAHEVQVLSIVIARPGRPREERDPARPEMHTDGPPAADEPGRARDRDWSRMPRKRGARLPLLLVIAQVKLADGAVATFRHAFPQAPTEQPMRLMALVAVTGVTVALLAGWTVRRLTRPLATLADAATGLARDLDRPPLPESGPVEVARAARAFNSMQRALKTNLETRSQALAGVSHDLRLPLTRARLRLERIADPAIRASIEGDLAEMERMISDTLDFLRAGSSGEHATRVNLNALAESVAEDMEALGATVQVRGQLGAPVIARPQSLRRAFANLMDNARRYGTGVIEVELAQTDRAVAIRIDDRGPGIPLSERERVFEPYVRLDPSRARHTGGTGLGLAIARAIARAHGGDVTLGDRAGGGLSVLLTLPHASADSTADGQAVVVSRLDAAVVRCRHD